MTVTTEELGSARIISWDNQRHRNAWGRATIAAIADALDARPRTTRRPLPRRARRGRGLLRRRRPVRGGRGRRRTASPPPSTSSSASRASSSPPPCPVIAAIDGVCIGGALEFAASCDLRIGTHRSRYATPEVRIGLGASNAGTLLLPEVLGESAARELLLTGAAQDGRLDEPPRLLQRRRRRPRRRHRRAGSRAFDATTRPAVARTKRMLNDRFGDLLPAAMERETQTCVELFPTPEAQEAVQRFARKD